ncbi:MAG: type II 3-dehydroquinate dehydratase [Capsulimonadales bacterium]|nr:type II 3-dehydroquinate dehydratase [Capsulimonadales bacterium]
MQISPSSPFTLAVLHGPNLNLLGLREPNIYGVISFDAINRRIEDHAQRIGVQVRIQQSNHEGVLIDAIHDALNWADGIVINPGAYTHYAYAIADALRAVRLPTVEVHISNVHAREEWRHHSVVSPVVAGTIIGFGANSYVLALDALKTILLESRQ